MMIFWGFRLFAACRCFVAKIITQMRSVLLQKERDSQWGGAKALVVPHGTTSDAIQYKKSAALHLWLFGYEVRCSMTSAVVHLAEMTREPLNSVHAVYLHSSTAYPPP